MLGEIKHYKIVGELGKGGMGVVFKAEDTRLGRLVALKLISPEIAEDPRTREKFFREARLASSLQHQNICTIHEIDETTDGQLFISMDYYEGDTLQHKLSEGNLPLKTVLEYAIQLTAGLNQAHTNHIVHRDIKPGNIMITGDDTVKILDFGLARLLGTTDRTQTGKGMGTIAYMSPELAEGKKIDHLTDIWSLGVVIYEMCTGELPFSNDYEAALIYSILDKSPLPPSEIREDIPEELERIIYRCLRKNKEERIQSASELLRELKQVRKNIKDRKSIHSEKTPSKQKHAERRFATILFSEITGYQEMLKSMEEEAVHAVMNQCTEIIINTANKFGGTFSGKTRSSFMLLFGIPESTEKAPAQAINTCIEVRKAIRELNKTGNLPVPLDLKCGIESGMVMASPVLVNDREEFSVTGDILNFAMQLKDLAREGQILAGPGTYSNTNRLFEYKPVHTITPEGRDEPVSVYLLSSTQSKRTKTTATTTWHFRSEMVGREKELETLHYYLLRLIRGEGFILNVIGEAGIGKSRLLAEFLKMKETGRVHVLEGRGLSSGLNLSFHPVMDIFRSLAKINESDGEPESLQKLEYAVQEFCPDSVSEVFPFLATFMGFRLSGNYAERIIIVDDEGLEKLIMKNLQTLLMGAADKQPLVFIIEDLHWADQSSIQLLKSLYRLAEGHPILFINVFRPGYQQTGERIREAIRDRYEKFHSEIPLNPLDDAQSERLTMELLNTKSLPQQVSAMINQRVEGNPLFIEEVIRSMVDEGTVILDKGTVRVTARITSILIPQTIQEVLMTRIDKLDEETRSVVKLASVIGRHFFSRVIREVVSEEVDINNILNYLLKIQLIRERSRMGEVEYLFKHALIQQAAYETIPSNQRDKLHLEVARAIEKSFADRIQDFFGILAYHYCHTEHHEKAEAYLIQAGEKALRSSASSEALHYYNEALVIYLDKYGTSADPAKVAELNKYIGIANYNTGRFIETTNYLEKVLAFHGKRIPKNQMLILLKAIYGLSVFLIMIRFPSFMRRKVPSDTEGEIYDLIYIKESALTITQSRRFILEMLIYTPWLTRYRFDSVQAFTMIGVLFSMGGVSRSVGKRVLDYCADYLVIDLNTMIEVEFSSSFQNLVSGDWVQEKYNEDLVHLGLKTGELYLAATHLGMQIQIFLERGERKAEEILAKLAEVGELYDYDYARLAHYTHGSLYLLKYREFNKALAMADEGIAWIGKNLGNQPGLLMIYSIKIKSLVMLGDLTGAEETMQVARDFANRQAHAPYFLSFFLTASMLLHLRQLEVAIKTQDRKEMLIHRKHIKHNAKRTLKVTRKVAFELIEVYRLYGIFFWITGKQGKALKWWTKAIREAEKMSAKLELSLTLMEVCRRLSGDNSKYKVLIGEGIDSMRQRAEQLFREMDIKIA